MVVLDAQPANQGNMMAVADTPLCDYKITDIFQFL